MDDVFRALADPTRREILDRLRTRNGQSLTELGEGLGMVRQSVTKHVAVLEGAGLVVSERRGRQRLHFLNAAPIGDIADRWIGRYHRPRAEALADLTHALEATAMTDTDFVYVTFVRTTAEQMWTALTEPTFTLRYWGAVLDSDWEIGSPVLWGEGDGPAVDLGQRVLAADRPHRLSYSWHGPQPAHAELFGWDDARLAEIAAEPRSEVTFTIDDVGGGVVRLTVVHDGFAPGSPMRDAVSGRLPQTGGWPQLLSGLKTLLETGDVLEPA